MDAGVGGNSGRGSTGTHHFYHDMEATGSLSTTVATAVAEVRGIDPLGLSLHDYVDTDALDALFAPTLDGRERAGTRLELSLHDHSVVVHGDGHIVVADA